jgi:hypothetical protein
MASKTSDLLWKGAQALRAVGPLPITLPALVPAVVLLATRARTAGDRTTAYRQRFSRYLAATDGGARY